MFDSLTLRNVSYHENLCPVRKVQSDLLESAVHFTVSWSPLLDAPHCPRLLYSEFPFQQIHQSSGSYLYWYALYQESHYNVSTSAIKRETYLRDIFLLLSTLNVSVFKMIVLINQKTHPRSFLRLGVDRFPWDVREEKIWRLVTINQPQLMHRCGKDSMMDDSHIVIKSITEHTYWMQQGIKSAVLQWRATQTETQWPSNLPPDVHHKLWKKIHFKQIVCFDPTRP